MLYSDPSRGGDGSSGTGSRRDVDLGDILSGAAQGGGWRIGNTPGKGGVREEEEPEIDMPPATPRGAAKDEEEESPPATRTPRDRDEERKLGQHHPPRD